MAEVVEQMPFEAESMKLVELLTAQRRWGQARARKLLALLSLMESKRVGTLTPRQRSLLLVALEAKDGEEVTDPARTRA